MRIVLIAGEADYGREEAFWLVLKDERGYSVKSARLVWEEMKEGATPVPTFSFLKKFPQQEKQQDLTDFLLSVETALEHHSKTKKEKIAEEKTPEKDNNKEFREAVEQMLKEHILVRKDDILALLSHSPKLL